MTAPAPPRAEIRLLRLMQELTEVLEHETQAVETHRHAQLPELVLRKQRLLADYQAELQTTAAKPEWMARLDPAGQEMLRAGGLRLDGATRRNAGMVKIALNATQRLLHGIMSSVRDEAMPRRGYQHLAQPNLPPPSPPVLFQTTA